MNRAELQTMARERLLDADALIAGQRWSFAYYVAGYAVECALKSCVLARMIDTGWIFQEKAKIADCLTHDFDELIHIAGMRDLLNAKLAESTAGSRTFIKYWEAARLWKVADRYTSKTEAEAITLRDAIAVEPDGMMTWIRNYW